MNWLYDTAALTPDEFWLLTAIVVGAGIVRGFSGFALSALIMASAVVILAPVELIPMLWWLEMSASLMMLKGGWADADRTTAYGLVVGGAIGWPFGLWLTMSLDVGASKAIALSIIVALAVLQLGKIKLPFLATRSGLLGSGILSGVASGLASVGGMVVALYVLASEAAARSMRGTLVLYLFLSLIMSMIIMVSFGVMTDTSVTRGLIFAIPTVFGVFIGQQLFIERLAAYYRPFCLVLLCALAGAGLIRTTLA